MGVDTKGYFNKSFTVLEFKQLVEKQLGVPVFVEDTFSKDYFIFNFTYNEKETRGLNVFFSNRDVIEEVGDYQMLVSLGAYGSSVEIISSLLKAYGGFLLPYDSGNDWEYIPPDKSPESTQEELLEVKLYQNMENYELTFKEKANIVRYVKENKEFLKTL
jgi:hypothetical protein